MFLYRVPNTTVPSIAVQTSTASALLYPPPPKTALTRLYPLLSAVPSLSLGPAPSAPVHPPPLPRRTCLAHSKRKHEKRVTFARRASVIHERHHRAAGGVAVVEKRKVRFYP
ncbi:uncharacterized protein VTP21DRAFT_9278 [Calcarisporiella thermophila]|uniref:uncharacterized protein n=1 Tax=Calcarisporiella thermophila TaxID=911321 RepID=UPI0037444755